MSASVVLLNWNGWHDTLACIQSLLAASSHNFKIIVCDNGSRDDSLQNMQDWCENQIPGEWQIVNHSSLKQGEVNKRVIIIDNQVNLGFAGGCNPGVFLALQDPDCEFVWLLNNDTEIEPDALDEALTYMRAHPEIGICGSSLIYYHERHKVQAWGGAHYNPVSGRSCHLGAFTNSAVLPTTDEVAGIENSMSYVIGAAMLIRREVFERVGLLEESYFLYFEELDFATRCRPYFQLGYAVDSKVYHKEGASIGTHASGGSAISVYYLYRNRLRYTLRHYPYYLPSVFICSLWELIKFSLKRRWPQAKAAARGICGLGAPIKRKVNG